MQKNYEHIVLGCGGLGCASAYWLGRIGRGDVLAIEQYRLGHDRGASEDHSRIIRHSYHTADYTCLTRASYGHWRELEKRTGLPLVHITGGLTLAHAEGEPEINSYARALAAQGHDYELLDAAGVCARWPQWRLDDDIIALYQANSGILDFRKATAAHVALARACGVTFLENSPVRRITPHPEHVEVHTDAHVFSAATLTVCAGSWTGDILNGLDASLPLTLTQEQVTYYVAANLLDFAPDRFPVWIFRGSEQTFYGFPIYGEAAVKAALDMSGQVVTQDTRRWEPDPGQTAAVSSFLTRHLPDALGPELYSKTCVYDLPPDRNFIVDTLPEHPRIGVCVGAGHAAKFAGLLGHIMADLAVQGQSDYPVTPFRLDRPALTDPTFPSDFRFANGARETTGAAGRSLLPPLSPPRWSPPRSPLQP